LRGHPCGPERVANDHPSNGDVEWHSASSIGQANPPGRTFHAGFRVGNGIHVFDVWDSEEAFTAFGEHLMPILAQHGIDPGEPRVGEIELIMTPD
jgi:hypothetical protein